MNTDDAIIWFTTMVDRINEAPPEIVAKLLPHCSTLTTFASEIKNKANELAKQDALPGYTKGPGRAKPMDWVEGADLPAFLYEKVLMTPAAAIKAKLVSEDTIKRQKWAVRAESEVVAIKLEEAKRTDTPRKIEARPLPADYGEPLF